MQVCVYLVYVEIVDDGVEAGVQVIEQGHDLQQEQEMQ